MSASLIALTNGTANTVVAPAFRGVDVGADTCATRARPVGSSRAADPYRAGGCFGATLGEVVAIICVARN